MVWEYYKTNKYEEAIQKAKDMGWANKEVQVRVEFIDYKAVYYVEPWERDCSCPNILKYEKHGK